MVIRLFPSRKDLIFSVNKWGKQICADIGKNPVLSIPISKISKKELLSFAQPPPNLRAGYTAATDGECGRGMPLHFCLASFVLCHHIFAEQSQHIVNIY